MPPVWNKALDFDEHPIRQLRVARCERNNDGFWIFAEQPEDELLERGPHASSVKFNRDHFAGGVQLGIGLCIVMHGHLSRLLLRTAAKRFLAPAAE
jgi:hypothetical protein